jgi:aminodeoxychorismate lyase|tara:strand:- start:1389 stop:2252 length:864 start_codon:yes stop_codon:yes gene_type:complete
VRVFFNGEFIPESKAMVPVTDRGWLYGDGLFDTMRLFEGKPFLWHPHVDRLLQGAALMLIRIPFSKADLATVVGHLMELNEFYDGVLRIQLSRAGKKRGYAPSNASGENLLVSLHPLPNIETISPNGFRLVLSTQVIPSKSYFAGIKSTNRLPQVMAAAEAEAADADDALLLNSNGQVVSATAGNLFWIENETVCTPPLESGCLPGVTRQFILEMCPKLDLQVAEKNINTMDLPTKDGIFITNSVHGVRIAKLLLNQRLQLSPVADKIAAAYDAALVTGALDKTEDD